MQAMRATKGLQATRMPPYVVLHKKRGETPLEAIGVWKAQHPEFADVAAAYAGRLDPMAEGKLLVLLGRECKRQAEYTKLDKEYEVEVLLGVSTDTGDVLGLPHGGVKNPRASHSVSNISTKPNGLHADFLPDSHALRQALAREVGSHSRKYPIFSSKTVNGKPLFLYALEGTLDTIEIPEHIETIYKIQHLDTRKCSYSELHAIIQNHLAHVPRSDEPSKLLGADFRQDIIREKWEEFFASPSHADSSASRVTILRLRITCGTGAYMRTLAERIGASLGTPALVLSITRTKIGLLAHLGPFSFWIRQY